jgi:hypothetical protein
MSGSHKTHRQLYLYYSQIIKVQTKIKVTDVRMS